MKFRFTKAIWNITEAGSRILTYRQATVNKESFKLGRRLRSRHKRAMHNWSPTIYNLLLLWRAGSVTVSTIHVKSRIRCMAGSLLFQMIPCRRQSGQATYEQWWLPNLRSAQRLISPQLARWKQRLTLSSTDLQL